MTLVNANNDVKKNSQLFILSIKRVNLCQNWCLYFIISHITFHFAWREHLFILPVFWMLYYFCIVQANLKSFDSYLKTIFIILSFLRVQNFIQNYHPKQTENNIYFLVFSRSHFGTISSQMSWEYGIWLVSHDDVNVIFLLMRLHKNRGFSTLPILRRRAQHTLERLIVRHHTKTFCA